ADLHNVRTEGAGSLRADLGVPFTDTHHFIDLAFATLGRADTAEVEVMPSGANPIHVDLVQPYFAQWEMTPDAQSEVKFHVQTTTKEGASIDASGALTRLYDP